MNLSPYGIYTTMTALATPALLDHDKAWQLILLVVGGLFGLITSVVVAIVKHWLAERSRLKERDADRARLQ